MIIGQVLVDGVSYSCHRYPDSRLTIQGVKRVLAEMVVEEQLNQLGKVEIRVHSQRGLDRLMAALLGLDPDR